MIQDALTCMLIENSASGNQKACSDHVQQRPHKGNLAENHCIWRNEINLAILKRFPFYIRICFKKKDGHEHVVEQPMSFVELPPRNFYQCINELSILFDEQESNKAQALG